MSIVALKRKTIAKVNISGSGKVQNWVVQGPFGSSGPTVVKGTGFSINGGHRNQGYVGQTSLSRPTVRTPFRGAYPMGTGGCCNTYKNDVLSNCGRCLGSSDYIKPSVLSTKGMLAKKLKWMNGTSKTERGTPAQNPTKPTGHYGEHTQGAYITAKKTTATTVTFLNKDDPTCKSTKSGCQAIKNEYFIGSQKYIRETYSKSFGPLSGHDYLARLKRKALQTTNCCVTTGPTSKGKCPIKAGPCATCDGHFEETAGGLVRSTSCGTHDVYPLPNCVEGRSYARVDYSGTCQCKSRWEHKGVLRSGCAKTEDSYGVPWCYVTDPNCTDCSGQPPIVSKNADRAEESWVYCDGAPNCPNEDWTSTSSSSSSSTVG